MDGIQITAKHKLETISKKELFNNVDSVKIKITKALLLPEDFETLSGDNNVEYPIIPARVAIGKIVETCLEQTSDMTRGTRVFPHPEVACGKCYECSNGKHSACSSLQIAGKTTDGFLRDFAVFAVEDISILSSSIQTQDDKPLIIDNSPLNNRITDKQALFIDHVALCHKIIDAIHLKKGEHVVIVGGNLCGIILAQLVIYYQGIPILVDNNEKNIQLAQSCGLYYTLFNYSNVDKSVAELTGARLAKKVVYMTGSNLNADIAMKLSGYNATVCFAGFGTPGIKVNFSPAILKQLNFTCVNNGYGYIDSAINLIATGAVDTSLFNIPVVKRDHAIEKIQEIAKSDDTDACSKMLIIDVE